MNTGDGLQKQVRSVGGQARGISRVDLGLADANAGCACCATSEAETASATDSP